MGDETIRPTLVGRSRAIREVLRDISRFAPLPYPVVIAGETGVGKELAARELHAQSGRAGPFVPVNCACLPDSLIESELFGHARGAFTGADRERPGLFEAAHGGTLLLDEAETLSLPAQERLLRAIESGEARRIGDTRARAFSVRIVAATNVDPAELVAEQGFRADLYFRLAVLVLRIPPLRERPEDIPDLAEHILKKFSRETGRPAPSLAPPALRTLEQYLWPGNVRELENVLRRAAVTADGAETLKPGHLVELFASSSQSAAQDRHARSIAQLRERGLPLKAIAARLGVTRKTLWAWRKRWPTPQPRLAPAAPLS
ncbi:MAG TPA: sigma 54-interacting transcriptional regulator [Planctomycetota bacterium]|nr:sigma 54-interacting transcriptional regulator [Planctomycetota bacterium]